MINGALIAPILDSGSTPGRLVAGRPTLYHYTCVHSRRQIGDAGILKPAGSLIDAELDGSPESMAARFVWLTDLRTPVRDALGLTSVLLKCDRTQYRYRVGDHETALPWIEVRRMAIAKGFGPQVEALESGDARPRHWWVSPWPVAVELDSYRPA